MYVGMDVCMYFIMLDAGYRAGLARSEAATWPELNAQRWQKISVKLGETSVSALDLGKPMDKRAFVPRVYCYWATFRVSPFASKASCILARTPTFLSLSSSTFRLRH